MGIDGIVRREEDSRVHHVEAWGVPTGWFEREGKEEEEEEWHNSTHEEACEWGRAINEEYIPGEIQLQQFYSDRQLFNNEVQKNLDPVPSFAGEYRLRTTTGPLPFSFDGGDIEHKVTLSH